MAGTSVDEFDFGSDPHESVKLLIEGPNATNNTQTPSPTTNRTDYALLIFAGAMPISATLVVLFLLLKRRKKV